MKIVQSSHNNIDIIDDKFLLSGHSFLLIDREFIEMEIRKTSLLYMPYSIGLL